jgi:dihydroorotate dehydrogenase electron transfer subunit
LIGRRACEVVATRASGSYVVFSLRDEEGRMPAAGEFYMLAAEDWEGEKGRPFLSRAFSVAAADDDPAHDGVRLDFLVTQVGPGTRRLIELKEGERVLVNGPLGNGFRMPTEIAPKAAGAILVGGGIGVAPIAIWRRALVAAGVPNRVLLGFRDQANYGGTDLFDCSEVRIATEDGSRGTKGRVTDLLGVLLEGDSADTAAVYACGPPAMLEAVRLMCGEAGVECELALETPMACGYGACFGCAVPLTAGGYARLCLEGPVLNGAEIETALVAGSGH